MTQWQTFSLDDYFFGRHMCKPTKSCCAYNWISNGLTKLQCGRTDIPIYIQKWYHTNVTTIHNVHISNILSVPRWLLAIVCVCCYVSKNNELNAKLVKNPCYMIFPSKFFFFLTTEAILSVCLNVCANVPKRVLLIFHILCLCILTTQKTTCFLQ